MMSQLSGASARVRGGGRNRGYVVSKRTKTIEELADEAWRALPNVWRRIAVRVRTFGRTAPGLH